MAGTRWVGGRWGVAVALLSVGMSVGRWTAWGQDTPPASASDATTEKHVTPDQAKELFKSVDEILQFASTDSKLPITHSVKRKLISRDQVTKFLRQKFDDDESTKRMERAELVLKKFGLLDRDFRLRPFLVKLLTEQIAGFYDDKTKTVNMLDWIAPEEQKPVLAHELTHALQDQKVDLDKWSDVEKKGVSKNVSEDNEHLQFDEGDTAREAVTEGQAMVVYVDYSLRSTGKTLADAPEMGDKLKDMTNDTSGSPVLARAPLLLQESLLFPYGDGLSFEQSVLVKAGREAAFAGVLAHPPTSSFEIIHPDAYIAHTPVPVLRLPDVHPLLDAEYTPYDIGVMGELDVRILLELFGGQQIATALSPEWKGGIYYAAQRKAATATEKQSTASLGLIYYSRWANPDSARSFLHVYAAQLPRKYSGVVRRAKDEADEKEQVYSTNEGDVLFSINGNGVFIAEGFALPLARKLRDSIVSAQPEGPIQVASSSEAPQEHGELTLSLSRYLSSFGMLKAAEPDAAGRYTLERR
jgi:hypothetical protein